VGASAAALLSVPVAIAFDVGPAAKTAFVLESGLWVTTTAVVLGYARVGRVASHRAWILRSFALAAFFISFSVWDPVLSATTWDSRLTDTVAVVLACLGNLALMETYLRATRAHAPRDLSSPPV